ncbi:MAG: ATP-binding cassette domain-containing protein, partial [Cyclobacteriaceae bacterium]
MDNSSIIKIQKLKKEYQVGSGSFVALRDVNLSFGKGEFAGLVGPSGSGKTTLLNIIGSLDNPTEGTVEVLGQSVSKLTHKQSAKLRNYHIGFIFQTYNLLPVYTVFENVEF